MTATPEATLVSPTWIEPVVPAESLPKNHSPVLAGRYILALLLTAEALAKYPDATDLIPSDHIVTLGFSECPRSDCHDPVARLHQRQSVNGLAEMIQSGTTCAADTYFFADTVAKALINSHFHGQA
jgi:hypothetical protein